MEEFWKGFYAGAVALGVIGVVGGFGYGLIYARSLKPDSLLYADVNGDGLHDVVGLRDGVEEFFLKANPDGTMTEYRIQFYQDGVRRAKGEDGSMMVYDSGIWRPSIPADLK